MNIRGVMIFAIVGIIIAMIIVVTFPVNCRAMQIEGFQSPIQTSCPSGSKSMYNAHGDLVCCAGEVNGNTCNGKILCTFSGNNPNYPSCAIQRIRKYVGEIDQLVRDAMSEGFVDKFAQILQMMNTIKSTLSTLPKSQISSEDLSIYTALLEEEQAWYGDNMTSDSITYQEECMYIIQRLKALFSGKPIMKNLQPIQTSIMKQMCSKIK